MGQETENNGGETGGAVIDEEREREKVVRVGTGTDKECNEHWEITENGPTLEK